MTRRTPPDTSPPAQQPASQTPVTAPAPTTAFDVTLIETAKKSNAAGKIKAHMDKLAANPGPDPDAPYRMLAEAIRRLLHE